MLYNNKLTRAVVLSYLTLPPGTNAPQTCRVAGRTGNERRVDIVISCANNVEYDVGVVASCHRNVVVCWL